MRFNTIFVYILFVISLGNLKMMIHHCNEHAVNIKIWLVDQRIENKQKKLNN